VIFCGLGLLALAGLFSARGVGMAGLGGLMQGHRYAPVFGGLIQGSSYAGGLSGLTQGPWFAGGFGGWWSSLIFVLVSYGGIEVMGVMAVELKNKRDTPKAGSLLLIMLTVLYSLSLLLVLTMVSWRRISATESPFVTALSAFRIPYLDTVFNLVIICAAFSTMVGALFTITRVMVSLAGDGDAPPLFHRVNARGVPWLALLLGLAGVSVFIVLSYLLPTAIYEYVTTAAGVILMLNWCIILASQIRLRHRDRLIDSGPLYRLIGTPFVPAANIAFILFVIAGALLHGNERGGVLTSLGIVAAILAARLLLSMTKGQRST
jgi:L-asparagine transporter-like permease